MFHLGCIYRGERILRYDLLCQIDYLSCSVYGRATTRNQKLTLKNAGQVSGLTEKPTLRYGMLGLESFGILAIQ